jgi:ELWxxDGT repeat protein
VTDGSELGTSELSGIAGASAGGLYPRDLTVFGSTVLFAGSDTGNQINLWVTDGTAPNTSELSVAGAAPFGLRPDDLTVLGSSVLFSASDSSFNRGLWVTDGTGGGTTELSIGGADANLNPSGLVAFDGKVLRAKTTVGGTISGQPMAATPAPPS